MNVSISLLVLKTHQLDRMVAFYSLLGIEFREEQHGSGPIHFASQLQSIVFEIYPLTEGSEADTTTRLGFAVTDLDRALESLIEHGFSETKNAMQTPWGYRALVRDPDGRTVELYQA